MCLNQHIAEEKRHDKICDVKIVAEDKKCVKTHAVNVVVENKRHDKDL